jgi:hypothetical protein
MGIGNRGGQFSNYLIEIGDLGVWRLFLCFLELISSAMIFLLFIFSHLLLLLLLYFFSLG